MFTPGSLTSLPDKSITLSSYFLRRGSERLDISEDGKILYVLGLDSRDTRTPSESGLAVDIERKTIARRFPLDNPTQPARYSSVMVIDGITYFRSVNGYVAWDENNAREQQFDFRISISGLTACYDHQRDRAYLWDDFLPGFQLYNYNGPGDFSSSGLTYAGPAAAGIYISHGFLWWTASDGINLYRRLGDTFTPYSAGADINLVYTDTREVLNVRGVAIWGNTLYTIDSLTFEPATIKAYTINP